MDQTLRIVHFRIVSKNGKLLKTVATKTQKNIINAFTSESNKLKENTKCYFIINSLVIYTTDEISKEDFVSYLLEVFNKNYKGEHTLKFTTFKEKRPKTQKVHSKENYYMIIVSGLQETELPKIYLVPISVLSEEYKSNLETTNGKGWFDTFALYGIDYEQKDANKLQKEIEEKCKEVKECFSQYIFEGTDTSNFNIIRTFSFSRLYY